MTTLPDTTKHPCFNEKAKGECGRVHLPVAPKCNIQCKYCNRKYDCVNESRPGVTSGVLTPQGALEYVDKVLEKEPRITVIGIAGPGDPFANAEETLESIRLIREKYPQLLFCVSSNGLGVPPYLDRIKELGITHLTITCNAVDPDIGEKFYAWVRDGDGVVRGRAAAELLLERQLEAIKGLKERGITVKVNTILTPGYNDHHIEAIAKKMAELGADILNIMPLKPVEGTEFSGIVEPSKADLEAVRAVAEKHIKQMRHCKRCRADAVGLLDEDKSKEFAGCLSDCKRPSESLCGGAATGTGGVSGAGLEEMTPGEIQDRILSSEKTKVAVATMEGLLVNKHLGEAEKFQIWTRTDGGQFQMIEERWAPEEGLGGERWSNLAGALADCRCVLVSRVGDVPQMVMAEHGVPVLEVDGFIEEALTAVFVTGDIKAMQPKKRKACGSGKEGGCSGTGEGCG